MWTRSLAGVWFCESKIITSCIGPKSWSSICMSLGITVENETWLHTEVLLCSNKREEECFSTEQSVSKYQWCLTSCSGYSNWPLRAGRSSSVIVMYHAGYTAICGNGFPLLLFVFHQTQNTEADQLQLSITQSICTHLIIENGVLWGLFPGWLTRFSMPIESSRHIKNTVGI